MRSRTVALIATVLMTVSLSACGISADENKANLQELQRRGFTTPVMSANTDGVSTPVTYSVGFGSCRITVTKLNAYWGWTYPAAPPSSTSLRDVDAAKLRANAKKVELEYCLKK